MSNKRRLELESDLFILESMLSEQKIIDDDNEVEALDIDKICDIMARAESKIRHQKNNELPTYHHKTIMIHRENGKVIMKRN